MPIAWAKSIKTSDTEASSKVPLPTVELELASSGRLFREELQRPS
jgi:hypothetical protein